MKPKLVLFGGTGGLGSKITPLLEEKFSVLSLGKSDLHVEDHTGVERFFKKEGYIPNIVYMPSCNYDAMLHRLEVGKILLQLEVNVMGFLNVLRYSLPLMQTNNYGRIVYISSILSEKPILSTGIYSATKAFNDNIIRTCALENARYNITCNSLQLGYFNAGLSEWIPQDTMFQILGKTPVARLGNEEDLTKAIEFIFDSPFLTGVNIPLSGGLHLA